MKPLRIAIIGFGKIAEDQHVPTIMGMERFELVATVSRRGKSVDGVASFTSYQDLLAADLDLDGVAITTPPDARYEVARACLEAGLHCLLEKPPTTTLGEIDDLACIAEGSGATLYATWHAQHNPAVDAAAEALAGKRIADMKIVWHEDVRKWHPGQQWIWEPGGFGVFDPGINAFSIATKIFPGPLFVQNSKLFVPANRHQPIAAEIDFKSPVADGALTCSLDWRYSDGESWSIEITTAEGTKLLLAKGGTELSMDGVLQEKPVPGEYPLLYRRFLDLIDARYSEVDTRPLRLVSDSFLLGQHIQVEPFED